MNIDPNSVSVVLLAGGQGKRLGLRIPKPLAPITYNNKMVPWIQLWIDKFIEWKNILEFEKIDTYDKKLLVTVNSEQLVYFNHKVNNSEVEYVIEENFLGTGGAVYNCLKQSNAEWFLVINSDTYVNCSLYDFFLKNNGYDCKMLLTRSLEERFGGVEFDDDVITKFAEKTQSKYINAGMYLIHRSVIESLGQPSSLEYDLFPKMVGKMGYVLYDSVFYDIGLPESYQEAKEFFASV